MTSKNGYTVQLNLKLLKKEHPEGDTTKPCNTSPKALYSYQQHMADYVCLFTEEGEELTLGEHQAAPLITEVCHHIPLLKFLDYLNLFIHLLNLSSLLQALQKIWLMDHIWQMADLLHADAIQQLEVVLLGSPALEVIDLLSGRLAQVKIVMLSSAQPYPCSYTFTPFAPPSASVPVVGVSEVVVCGPSHFPAVPTIKAKSHGETTLPKANLISQSVSAYTVYQFNFFPVVAVPELAIPAEAYPVWLNRPGGGKDYLCHLCHFRHSNLDCILTHIRKHLGITIGCPICCRGYLNATSLHEHGGDVHGIQIVASSISL